MDLVVDIIFWIYDKLTGNKTRWYTADGKIRGAYIKPYRYGIGGRFSACTPKVLRELEEMVDKSPQATLKEMILSENLIICIQIKIVT